MVSILLLQEDVSQFISDPIFNVCFVFDLCDKCSLHMCNYFFILIFSKNSGTQLVKKIAAAPVKTLSQTTNAVVSTVQTSAVIQVLCKLYTMVE